MQLKFATFAFNIFILVFLIYCYVILAWLAVAILTFINILLYDSGSDIPKWMLILK
jgi:hypothetical protein